MRLIDGVFQVGVVGSGQCDRPGKPSGPPLLKFPLKVKRIALIAQSYAFVVAWPHNLTRLVAKRSGDAANQTSARSRKTSISSKRSRWRPYRRRLQTCAARGLDARQDHWRRHFWAGVGLNRYAAWIEQDREEWHEAHLNQGESVRNSPSHVERQRVSVRIHSAGRLRRYPPDSTAFALPSDSAQALATAEFG